MARVARVRGIAGIAGVAEIAGIASVARVATGEERGRGGGEGVHSEWMAGVQLYRNWRNVGRRVHLASNRCIILVV